MVHGSGSVGPVSLLLINSVPMLPRGKQDVQVNTTTTNTHYAGGLQHGVVGEHVDDIDLEAVALLASYHRAGKDAVYKDCSTFVTIRSDVAIEDDQVSDGSDCSERRK